MWGLGETLNQVAEIYKAADLGSYTLIKTVSYAEKGAAVFAAPLYMLALKDFYKQRIS